MLSTTVNLPVPVYAEEDTAANLDRVGVGEVTPPAMLNVDPDTYSHR